MENSLEQAKIKVGINKTIFEKRLHLKLSRKEAAKKLGISKFKLTIIERGYIKVSPKMKEKIKLAYEVDDSFFYDNYEYPVLINEKLYEPVNTNTLLDKLGKSKVAKIISIALSACFIAMGVAGICISPRITGTTGGFYTDNVKYAQQYVIKNGKEGILIPEESDFSVLIADRYYYLEKEYKDETKAVQDIKINFFKKDVNLPFAFAEGKYKQNFKSELYNMEYQCRFIANDSVRVHVTVKDYFLIINYNLAYINCDVSIDPQTGYYVYKYNGVVKTNQGQGNVPLYPGDEYYKLYTEYFEANFGTFVSDVQDAYTELIPGAVPFSQFGKEMKESTTAYYSRNNTSSTLCIIGFLFGVLAIGVVVLCFMFRNSANKKLLKFENETREFEAIPTETVPIENDKKELPRNKFFDMVIPEFGVRGLSLILLFISSLATYLIFANAVALNITGIVGSLSTKNILAALSVVAVILLYFVKLDIYQNKKSAFVTNMFLFILGLLYYVVLLLIYYGLVGLNDTIGTLTTALFSLLPGNIVWAVLVFNMIIIFMFAPVKEKNKHKKNAELKLRLMTLLPFAYLIASCIIYGGIAACGWNIPYAVASLFITKAPMITVFAILYCVAVFIYRRYTKKKYGDVNAVIYRNGNKYNFQRNIIAASIVTAIGLFDLLCFFYWPNNPLGFGVNWTMLIAVPLILFYHPHIGKRNGTWDIIYLILYGIAYIIGIVLIVFALLGFLMTI